MQLLFGQRTLDDSPIARLYQHYWLTILASIRQHISSREDAEDILLEVFVAALESTSLLTMGEKQQLAWLRHVAHLCQVVVEFSPDPRRGVVLVIECSLCLINSSRRCNNQRFVRALQHER